MDNPGPVPELSAKMLNDGQAVMARFQRIMGLMATNDRRNSPQFLKMLDLYKDLGTAVHNGRRQLQLEAGPRAADRPQRPSKAAPSPRLATGLTPRPAQLPGSPALAANPGGVSALGRGQAPAGGASRPAPAALPGAAALAAQAYARPQQAEPEAEPEQAAATAVILEAAAAPTASQAAQAYGARPAEPLPRTATAGAPQVAATLVSAAQAYGTSVLPAAREQETPAGLPPGLPLQMPKFKSGLGPPSPKTIYKGPEVQNLQALLAQLGYVVEPTGTFDVQTLRAVNLFQKRNKVPVGQIVGAEMRRLLNELVTG